MLVLIAESKTMAPCDRAVSVAEYAAHRPALEDVADEVMSRLRTMPAEYLSERTGLSMPMSRRLRQMIYEFPNKALGCEAIEAFTGVVFKAFGYSSLDIVARQRTNSCVRILSSAYGWLRPDDIVKPYRFDYTMRLADGDRQLAAFWRDAVTECVLRDIESEGSGQLLNLLPADAARCIDWKRVMARGEVWSADFREIRPGGVMRTPNAGWLKTLRGKLLRQIVTQPIADAAALAVAEGDGYVADSAGADRKITFLCADY